MENKLTRKYGLLTAICMVVGIVIGSGVFFKAEAMLNKTSGDLPVALLAWLCGGIVMMISAYVFATMGTRFEKVNGVVDYAEALVGKKYAYYVGWFSATIYYPAMTSALAWLSARYTIQIFSIEGVDAVTSGETMALAAFYLAASFAINTLSPKIAGYFQVSTTIIKLIPLCLMAVVGIIYGIVTGTLTDNFNSVVEVSGETVNTVARNGLNLSQLIPGICTSVFAYEGWVIATSINSELKDSKKNLPRALILGTFIVVAVYMLYYLGISGSLKTADLTVNGASLAFKTIFGNVAGTILTVFIAISCLGTLNGLTLACGRGFYSLAARGHGPKPAFFAEVDKQSQMPSNAGILALVFNGAWLFYFFIANLSSVGGSMGIFAFDSTELPLICLYAFYIPIYIMFIAKAKDEKLFKRIIMPVLAILGAILFLYAAVVSHGIKNVGFLIIALVIMVVGGLLYKKDAVNIQE